MIELHPSQYLVMIRPCDIVLTNLSHMSHNYIFLFLRNYWVRCGRCVCISVSDGVVSVNV